MVEVAMSLHQKGPLSIEEFVKNIREQGEEPDPSPRSGQTVDHSILFGGDFPTFKKLTAIYTNEALKRSDKKKSEAARKAGLSRSTFIRYWEDSNSLETKRKKRKKGSKKLA
jgi:DNA-binding NtrC family response regulator